MPLSIKKSKKCSHLLAFVIRICEYCNAFRFGKRDKNNEKMNRIKTMKQGEVKALAQLFQCKERTVNNALNGRTNSQLVQQIRTAAVERGAAVIEKQ